MILSHFYTFVGTYHIIFYLQKDLILRATFISRGSFRLKIHNRAISRRMIRIFFFLLQYQNYRYFDIISRTAQLVASDAQSRRVIGRCACANQGR